MQKTGRASALSHEITCTDVIARPWTNGPSGTNYHIRKLDHVEACRPVARQLDWGEARNLFFLCHAPTHDAFGVLLA
jgi:hypothetical protein